MFDTIFVLVALAGYVYATARMIRWASEKSDQPTPGWWDCIGMMLWPALCRRVVGWIVPDAWGWPEKWIGVGVGAVVMLLILTLYFKLRLGYAILIFVAFYVSAVLLILEVMPYLRVQASPAAS